MTKLPKEYVEQYLAEYKQYKGIKDDHEADEGPESVLQGKIVKWAKDHGYPCLSLKQSKKARGYIIPGWPDVTLALPGGRAVWLELKAQGGYLRKEQKQFALMFMQLGHEWYQVKSFKRFLEIVNGKISQGKN